MEHHLQKQTYYISKPVSLKMADFCLGFTKIMVESDATSLKKEQIQVCRTVSYISSSSTTDLVTFSSGQGLLVKWTVLWNKSTLGPWYSLKLTWSLAPENWGLGDDPASFGRRPIFTEHEKLGLGKVYWVYM